MGPSSPVADRFIAELNAWLTPDLVYHCFTGETDEKTLKHIAGLRRQPWLLEPILSKAERGWPQRLADIEAKRRRKKQEDKAAVQQFVLTLKASE